MDLAEGEVEIGFQLGDFRPFAGLDQGEGNPLFAGPRRPAAAVGEVFDLLGELVVDDEGKPFDIDPAGEAVVMRMNRDLVAAGATRVRRTTLVRGKDSADALRGVA